MRAQLHQPKIAMCQRLRAAPRFIAHASPHQPGHLCMKYKKQHRQWPASARLSATERILGPTEESTDGWESKKCSAAPPAATTSNLNLTAASCQQKRESARTPQSNATMEAETQRRPGQSTWWRGARGPPSKTEIKREQPRPTKSKWSGTCASWSRGLVTSWRKGESPPHLCSTPPDRPAPLPPWHIAARLRRHSPPMRERCGQGPLGHCGDIARRARHGWTSASS